MAALALAIGGPWLIIAHAAEIDSALAALLGRADGAGPLLDAAISALILLIAFAGSLLLRQRIGLGTGSPATITALPIGMAAPGIALSLAAAAGVVVAADGRIETLPLFLSGSLLIVAKALGEEILFRGLLQPLLCRAWGAAVAIVVSSLAFTAIHVIGGWRDPISLLNITLAGGWFGLLAWRTGGILAPTLAHAGYNWAEEMLFGAVPNPGIGSFGAFFNVELVGPAWLGGSADGLNASFTLTAVLVAIILPLVLRRRTADAAWGKQERGYDQ